MTLTRTTCIAIMAALACATAAETIAPPGQHPPAENGGTARTEPTTGDAAAKPAVEEIGPDRFRVGKVEFNRKKREVRIPTRVNMTQGLLEFVAVHQNGKIHESLLFTEASPTDVNVALKLLRFQASRELYPLPNETGGTSGKFPKVPEEVRRAARVLIEVEWQDEGKTRKVPVNDWIQHAVKSTPMPAGPWVYGGSEFVDGKFAPELSGDIVAIFTALSALINYPGDDHRDDTVWVVHPKRVPPEGTHVTLIISPFQDPSNPKQP